MLAPQFDGTAGEGDSNPTETRSSNFLFDIPECLRCNTNLVVPPECRTISAVKIQGSINIWERQRRNGVLDQIFIHRVYGSAFWIILEGDQVREGPWLDDKHLQDFELARGSFDRVDERLVACYSVLGNRQFARWFGCPTFTVREIVDDECAENAGIPTRFDYLQVFGDL